MTTLFLAHAAADRDRAHALAAGLRAAALTVRAEHQPAGDAGWWAGILEAIQDTDAFLYATMPGEAAPGAVEAEREYAAALGIPTLEVHLSGPGAATGIDFRRPDADAAFRLIGAIAALPPPPPARSRPPSPESPFAAVADLARDVWAAVLGPADQHALVDRLRAAPDGPPVRELAAVLRLRTDLDAGTVRRLDESFPPAGPARPQTEAGKVISRPGALTADDVHRVAFGRAPLGRRGYDEETVDRFLDTVEADLRARHAGGPIVQVALTADDVHAVTFIRPPFGRRGYDGEQVDRFLAEVRRTFTALDSDLTGSGATVVKA